MQSIPFHISYLLAQNESVIIPDFGAFIVTLSDKESSNRWGVLFPPENVLVFDPNIIHYDDLLAESIAKENKISLNDANQLIAKYVRHIKKSLDEDRKVHIHGVGTLRLIDNKFQFQPDKILSCNSSNFGLTGFSLPQLIELQQEAEENNFVEEGGGGGYYKKQLSPRQRKLIIYACAFAAALIAMCLIPTPLNDNHSSKVHTQYASITSFSEQDGNDEEHITSNPEMALQTDSSELHVENPTSQSDEINLIKLNRLHYYIIVSDSPDQASANKLVDELKSKGFDHAAILYTDERLRIYTNHFEDKKEAENFFIQFRKNYPEYPRAWMLSSLPPNQTE